MSSELNKEEEVQQRPFHLGLTMQLLSYLKPHRSRVILAFATIVLAAVSSQAGPWLTQVAVDEHIINGDWEGLKWMIIAFFLSVAVQYVAQYAQTMVTGMMGQHVMYDMRRDIFAHLQRLPLSYFDRTPLGRIMTRSTNDVDALNEFFSEGVVSVFMDLFTLFAILGFMAYIDLELTLICCSVIPVIAVTTFYLQGLAMKAYRELRVRLARLNSYLQENITGIEVVQLFNRQLRNLRDFDDEHLPYRRAEDREIHFYAIFFPFTEFIGTFGMALVIWYGAGAVIESRVELGVLVAFLQYIRRFFRPIMDISDRYALLQSAMAASERIFELLATPLEPEGGPRRNTTNAARGGTIEFRNVSFKYDETAEDWILKNVSFKLAAGQSLALVGATGSGKTTIVSLICRFYDIQQGEILVDDLNVREWHVEELRRRISIVQQDVFLFSGNIGDNIRLGETAIGKTEVEQAARYVNAAPFVERLPEGYEHAVAEGGSTLSAGQRQLLSFARALAFDPEILVLDEATSSIDTETEQLIQDAIAKLMHDRTSIVIAHRLSTIRSADQILVLHRGEVRERGRHEELLKQGGIYARLHRLNYSGAQS
ncbi:MAG: ABC transporter ATP-binding protein [Gemmatimonadetes bacterium]|jgi:ATP-binding cassette subfamily B protein|nr:ABC transporter ATP-binding protein [Gemmatimonadota bacterium]MBT5324491.1 ABC transporter ATP-binding protein [Gemmatimonadota bacterium]MBT5451822.1 ABC transporter ATP-binding protein [Gemmatimonadota bacterium]MBT5802140.1 ABC transporter ATP-binding protein [Gemmatimonadota bacterium]MBT6619241.1 ABC transporter ATP-binding protein [Gemmatimonadota bacterium]